MSIKFNFKINILRQPKQLWKIIIVTNRSANYKPIILENTNSKINFTGSIDGFYNYLNLNKNNLNETVLFFYSYIEDKNKELQVNKIKKYNLIDLIKKKEKKINFGNNIILLLKNIKLLSYSIKKTSFKPHSNRNNVSKYLSIYRKNINKKLTDTFYIKNGETWHVIYYSLNVFNNFPIVGSIINDNEESNELFWVNLYNCVREIYKDSNIEWDPKVCWVNLFTAINNFAHNYVMENKDVYMESWFSRFFDCDESTMVYIQYQLFWKCKFTPNTDLFLIKKYYISQYIGFTGFWYVTNYSANDTKVQKDNFLGHHTAAFWLRSFFYDHWINKPKNITTTKSDQSLEKVLIAETTAFMHPNPNFKVPPVKRKMFTEERKIQFLKNSKFYYRVNTLTTTKFLDKNICGFFCGRQSKKRRVLRYGIKFKHFYNLKRVVFVSLPKLSDELIRYTKICAEQRTPIPKFLCYMSNDKIVHYESFKTIEKTNKKFKNIINFLKTYFSIIRNKKYYSNFHIFSLDDLMKKNVRKKLINLYSKQKIDIKVYELYCKTYTFTIKI